jgi:hypothetical protein
MTTWIRLAVLSGVAALVSAFLGWQAGQISVSAGAPPAPTPWELPSRPTEDTARDLAILNARHPWTNPLLAAGAGAGLPGAAGGAGAAGAGASNPKPAVWRLAGIVQRPGEDFALIVVGEPGAAKLEYRRVGDSLPDGSTLVQITADNAVTKSAGSTGEQRVYWLFRGKS